MNPMFSICIASYNYAGYILKGLNAIKDQSFTNYEVIICDDASTDNSVDVINEFIANNPNMDINFIIKDKNEGLIANKNSLIDAAKGEYTLLCDADDWMADDCLQKVADMIEKEHPDRVICDFAHIDQKGNIIQVEHILPNQTKWGWNVHHASFLKTSILHDNNIHIIAGPDDVFLTIEFSKYCKSMSIINETLYYWLVHLDSTGRKDNPDMTMDFINNVFCYEYEYIENVIKGIESNMALYEGDDIEELRLVLLKLYYFNIFFGLQSQKLCNKLKFYRRLRSKIKELDKLYLHNKYLSRRQRAILRPYALNAIRLFVILEKCKMMVPALVGYHLISKVKYFDQ